MLLQQSSPIMVRVVEEPVAGTTYADFLLGVIGLIGVLVVLAVLAGALFGGLLIGFKRLRHRLGMEPVPDHEAMKISPYP